MAPTPSSTARVVSVATITEARPSMYRLPLKSARRRACGRRGQVYDLPTPPTGEQKQTKRTFDVLPKTANLISYRHCWSMAFLLKICRPFDFSHVDLPGK